MATPSPNLDMRAASLFDVDSELGELLAPRQLAEARVRAIVPIIDLPAGPWSPAPLRALPARPFALLVLEGLVVREVLLVGTTTTELLGPCDLADLGVTEEVLLPTDVRWSAPEGARVAVLDDRLLGIVRAWPSVARVLLDRAARRGARLSTHRAIAQLPRVDQRLMAFFGHAAERWGRIAPDGVVIPLQLTHETLGRLIGARRPTVSLALKDLAAAGVLARRSDGAWLLGYEAFRSLRVAGATQSSWQPADARPVADADTTGADGSGSAASWADEFAALQTRLTALHAQHAVRMRQSAALLERCRTRRLQFADRRRVAAARSETPARPETHGPPDGRATRWRDELAERRDRRDADS